MKKISVFSKWRLQCDLEVERRKRRTREDMEWKAGI
jgi:hypothetical protein